MNKIYLLKKLSIILLSIAILSMLVVIGLQRHQLSKGLNMNREEVNETTTKANVSTTAIVSTDSALMSEERQLQYEKTIIQLKSKINELKENNNRHTEVEIKQMTENELRNPIGPTRELEDVEKMTKYTAAIAISTFYDSFLNGLKLSPEDLEKVKELITDRLATQLSMMSEIYNTLKDSTISNGTDELLKQTEIITNDYDNQIKEILSEKDYESYKNFQATTKERTVTTQFKEYLFKNRTNQELDTQTENDLIQAMYEGRKELNIEQEQLPDFSKQDPEVIEEYINNTLNNQARVDEEYIKRAEDILTGAQLEQFKNYLQQQSAKTKQGLEMLFASQRMAY